VIVGSVTIARPTGSWFSYCCTIEDHHSFHHRHTSHISGTLINSMMKSLFRMFFVSTLFYGSVHLSIVSKWIHPLSDVTAQHGSETSQFSQKQITWSSNNRSSINNNNNNNSTKDEGRQRALIISVAPRTIKHVVALWTELECFTLDVDYVILSGPDWSKTILQQIVFMAKQSIPHLSSTPLTFRVFVNDRYDVGLWCDALEWMDRSGDLAKMHQVELLNDSVFALRKYSAILNALEQYNASMTSLSYSYNRPEGSGSDKYWVESIWRGFDRTGVQTFKDYSCRLATDPMFCSRKWWGKKGCIVENFERNMARQFPRDKVVGLFPSDVPPNMLTRKQSFPNWVRHPPYWQKLVEEEKFPVAKVNWPEMIGSIDDDRLHACTNYLDRSVLDRLDFAAAVKAI
jgi:hypothetical protein